MRKTKKFIIALLSLILLAFGVAGCNSGTNEPQNKTEEKPATIKNIEAVMETTLYKAVDGCKDFIALCNSLEEFKEQCLRNGYDFFDESNQKNNDFNTDAGSKIRGYTDEYFENNAFIVCAFIKGSWSGQYRIEGVEVTSNKLTLCIKSPENYAADTIMNRVFLIAGVNKSSVSDVTDLEYVFR